MRTRTSSHRMLRWTQQYKTLNVMNTGSSFVRIRSAIKGDCYCWSSIIVDSESVPTCYWLIAIYSFQISTEECIDAPYSARVFENTEFWVSNLFQTIRIRLLHNKTHWNRTPNAKLFLQRFSSLKCPHGRFKFEKFMYKNVQNIVNFCDDSNSWLDLMLKRRYL